jgi:quercetin dioxygenase-like cupin family protein
MNVYREHSAISSLHQSQICLDNSALHDGNVSNILVSGADTGGHFALVHVLVSKGREPPRHIHSAEDEIVYVLDGAIEFYVGDTRVEKLAGNAIVLPREIEHSFRLRSDQATLLVMLTPAVSEGFIKELSELTAAHSGILSAGACISVEQLVTIAARHGLEITGPS